MSAGFIELAERCERQDGPLFVLDDAIAKAVHLAAERMWSGLSRPYTASVDAAMTLIPDGWEWQMENTGGDTFGPYRVQMGHVIDIEAKTLPLAICAAALRAKTYEAVA